MTSGMQPPFSGAPTPVQGVTGGPPVLGGQIGNDPQTGNVVVAPNPGQVLQIRKGSNPVALQVYEYFHTNTDYSRLALNSTNGGPFSLAVETAPSTVIRDLQILANGHVFIPNLSMTNGQVNLASDTALPGGTRTQLLASPSLAAGTYLITGVTQFACPTAATICHISFTTGTGINPQGNSSQAANVANAQQSVISTFILVLAATDTIQLWALSNAASTANSQDPGSGWPNATHLNWLKIG